MKTEVLVPTTDQWYGNWNDKFVKLIYNGKLDDGSFRVSCWGTDDFGIDKDFNTEREAIEIFKFLQNSGNITQQALYDLGFSNF